MRDSYQVNWKALKRCLAGVLAMPLVFWLLPVTSAAAGTKTTLDISYGKIVIGAGTVDGYDGSGNHITTADSDGYIITGYSYDNSGEKLVSVTGGTHDIVLSNLTIYNRYSSQSSAFYVASGATAHVTLDGANILHGYACGMFIPEGATLTISGDASDTLKASVDQVGAGIGGRKAISTSYAPANCGIVSIYGGTITAIGGDLSAGIGAGEYGHGGTINIYGGTVTASGGYGADIGGGYGNEGLMDKLMITGGSVNGSLGKTPVDASNRPVYSTAVTMQNAANATVSALIVKQGGSTVSYGITGMKTDANGKLNLYLPASSLKTTADLTVNGITYNYSGIVGSSSTNSLKLNQAPFSVSVNSSYVFGDTISPVTAGGTLGGAPVLTYSGTDGVTGATLTNSPVKPTNVGSYTVTAVLPGNDVYNDATASVNFTITKKSIAGFSVNTIDDQTYTGTAVVPAATVKDTSKNITLVSGKDYDVICADVNVGPASAVITGKGNYTGSISKSFNIIKKTVTVSLAAAPEDTTKVGNDITLTAKIQGAVDLPEGTVTFKANGSVISANTDISESGGNYAASAVYSSVPAGSYTFTAVYNATANDNYSCTSNGTISYIVTKYDQTGFGIVDGTDYELSDGTISKTYGDTPFALAVAGKLSGGTVTFSSSDTGVAVVDGNGRVSLLKSGTVTLSAESPADDRYNAATSTVTLHVGKANQSGFGIVSCEDYVIIGGAISKTYGDAPFALVLTDKLSEGAVTFSSSDTSVAAVAENGCLSLLKSGTVTLSAESPADDRYNAATATVTLHISKANQSGFGILSGENYQIVDGVIGKTYEDAPFSLEVTGVQSTNAVAYAVTSGSDVVAVDAASGQVSLQKSGTSVITATSPADECYNEVSASVTVQVEKANQSGFGVVSGEDYQIVEGAISKTYGDMPFSLKVTGVKSANAVTYSATSGSDVITVDAASGQVSLKKSGTAVITATSPADECYNEASASITVQVEKANQSGFGIADGGDYEIVDGAISKTYGDTPFTLKVTGVKSVNAVAYSVTSGSDVIAVDAASGQVSLQKSGTAVITATSPADECYNEASASITVQVEKALQSGFAFDASSINKTYGDGPFVILASGGQSTGEVTYAVTDGVDVLSVDQKSGQVMVLKSGMAVVTATKAADECFNEAAAQLPIHVAKADQGGFRFNNSTAYKTFGEEPFVVALSGRLSSSQVAYAVTDGSDVAAVDSDSGQVTMLRSGTAVVTATSRADDRYNEATAQLTVRVSKAEQKDFKFAETSITKTFGEAPFVISAADNQSSGGIIYTVADGNDVAGIDEHTGLVTMIRPGTALITAKSLTDNKYNEATAQITLIITKAEQSGFGFVKPLISKAYGDASFGVSASGGQSSGMVAYGVTSGAGIVSVEADTGQVTIHRAGTAVITAVKTGDEYYNVAASALTIHVDKAATSVITPPTASDIPVIGRLSASALTGGEGSVPGRFSWTNPDQIVSASGTYGVTFTPEDSANYKVSTCEIKVQVTPVIIQSDTGIEYDLSQAELPSGVTSVSIAMSVEPADDSNGSVFSELNDMVSKDSGYYGNVLTVYDLKLLDQSGDPITDFNGMITVRLPVPKGTTGDLRVMWYDSVTGALTDMNARMEDGYLVFETNHFSYYAIVHAAAPVSSSAAEPNANAGNSAEITVSNPDAGDSAGPIVLLVLIGIVLVCGVIAAVKLRNKNKRCQ